MKFYNNSFKDHLKADKVSLIQSGNNYFETLRDLIDNAKQYIQFQTYIFDPDTTGLFIAKHLKLTAQRGVKINILLDAFGSQKLNDAFLNDLRSYGIFIRLFSPLFSNEAGYFGRRLHQKVIVVDGRYSLVGGINIANKYSGYDSEPPWLDYAVLVDSNSLGLQLTWFCDLYLKREQRIFKVKPRFERISFRDPDPTVRLVSFKINDWVRRRSQISKSYRSGIARAERSIVIVGSYFLPGYRFRRLLKLAIKRGVNVKVIISGVSDVPILPRASRFLYSFLLRNKIEVYEWSRSVLHGKAIIVDGVWTSIGSYNMNSLSDYRSIELNLQFYDTSFAGEYLDHLNTKIFPACELLKENELSNKFNYWQRFLNWISYVLIKIGLRLFLIRTRNEQN